ncbi:nicotinate-nucleotide--dimethylbenzimidazole phosphoribosyltransferase [Ohtaekwangia koreensis]|uniref:Nicotinate-nucleotide--dimethylbenzimidazole phosphoribosyltransferase n=1 Tax=Ohtaekwangia koreensis TaxID=688867 RepID=A0A1T5IQT7_9BACT|nr:nicotinate-nucleotide--dimethylbenzimidazole phosphoribosyltransferase [Ohtaekwangia koreensis]SKC41554.1 nicotinate-nucleotide-dimethylbenzimidazole phosphoribosyltransferase [Ohtaekwangia koreensis]
MKKFKIKPVNTSLEQSLKRKIDQKTKPLGALGRLEELALQIGTIQQTLTPSLSNPHILVFAGDHGIVEEGVSAYPQEVTWQMVMNFIQGGAAINVFCKQHGITLNVVDAGVNYDFPEGLEGLVYNKVGKGTRNFLKGQAMTIEQAQRCIESSSEIIKSIHAKGCNIIGFGEMGIGNTTSASALMSLFCDIPVAQCVGLGTGLNESALQHKTAVVTEALKQYNKHDTPIAMLATFGGFEIAQIVGAMLQAAELGMIILVDGFITTSAYLVAQAIEPAVRDYSIFCHQSQEKGHTLMLQALDVKPLLDLNMRLGEGTGAAVAYPIVQSAVAFLNQMASFESASVSGKKA